MTPELPATAVVTGGSRGIGLAVAERLSAGGTRVLLIARDAERLREAAGRLGAEWSAVDLASAHAGDELVSATEQKLATQAPAALINAAGAFALSRIAELDAAAFDAMIAANLRAPFIAIRAFLPAMLERGSGHIVSIGSIAGRVAFPSNGAYAASKFGLRGLHEVLDAELRGTGVRSTLVDPAATDTEIWNDIDRARHGPLPEASAMLQAGDVADAVVYALTTPARVGVRNIFLERS